MIILLEFVYTKKMTGSMFMRDETSTILIELLKENPLLEKVPGNNVFPCYNGASLANLHGSICRWLDIPLRGIPLNAIYHQKINHVYQHILLFVLDGLGLKVLEKILFQDGEIFSKEKWSELLDEATLFPLTSVVPSTTSAALTSLWTGSTPAEHGVVGYEVWLKEYGIVANMIKQAPASFVGDVGGLRRAGFQPQTFLPVQPLSLYLKSHQIQSTFFIDAGLAQSGLTLMQMPEARIQPYYSLNDARLTIEKLFAQHGTQKSFTAVYGALVDTFSHLHGPDNIRIKNEVEQSFNTLLLMMRTMKKNHQKDTLILLTADHGQISTPADALYDLRNHAALPGLLAIQPTGESRMPYFFVRQGKEQIFLEYFSNHFDGSFNLFKAQEILASGLLGSGTMHPHLEDRLGDWVAIAQGKAYLWWKNNDNNLLGRHGGLSPEEMLIPLIAWEL